MRFFLAIIALFMLLVAQNNRVDATKIEANMGVTEKVEVSSIGTIYMNGKQIIFEEALPIIIQEELFVPIQEIVSGLGADISWDNLNGAYTLSLRNIRITFNVNNSTANVNTPLTTYSIIAQSQPFIERDRLYIPLDMVKSIFEVNTTMLKEGKLYLFDNTPTQFELEGIRYYRTQEYKPSSAIDGNVVGYSKNGMQIVKEKSSGKIYVVDDCSNAFYYRLDAISITT